MSLSPKQIDKLADNYIIGLYEELEREVIADIARRVSKTGRYTETAELMAKAMREQGFSTGRIQREVMKLLRADPDYKRSVAQTTKEYKQYISNVIRDTVTKAANLGDRLIGAAGDMAFNDDLKAWKDNGVDLTKPSGLGRLFDSFKKQTKGELRNITNTMAFKSTALGTVGVTNAVQRALDMAVLKTSTGTFSYNQAVKDVITEMARSGLRSVDYASGRSYQLDTAARMCVRTACSQLAGKITEENLKKTGQDLVYVSAHPGARPTHAQWQGKVYYFFEERPVKGYHWIGDNEPVNGGQGCGYGQMLGLKGINCTHEFYPYFEGTSVIPEFTEHEPVTYKGKEMTYYEATQEQRRQERAIRATKREIEACEVLGEDTAQLKAKLQMQSKEYKRFSEIADLRPKPERTQVIKGTSDLTKTTTYRKNSK